MSKSKPSKLGTSSEWIAARFRDERARLELTHVQVATAAQVSRNAAMAWEKGTAIPSSALGVLSEVGFDPQFIVTGLHSTNLHVLHGGDALAAPEVSKDEWEMLRSYRALSEIQRQQARGMLQVLRLGMQIGGSTVVTGSGNSRVAGGDFTENVKRKKR